MQCRVYHVDSCTEEKFCLFEISNGRREITKTLSCIWLGIYSQACQRYPLKSFPFLYPYCKVLPWISNALTFSCDMQCLKEQDLAIVTCLVTVALPVMQQGHICVAAYPRCTQSKALRALPKPRAHFQQVRSSSTDCKCNHKWTGFCNLNPATREL